MTNQLAAAALMLKLLAGVDIIDSVLTDLKASEDSKDKEFYNLIVKAKEASEAVISKYDNMIPKHDVLSTLYENCNRSVEWQIKKIIDK